MCLVHSCFLRFNLSIGFSGRCVRLFDAGKTTTVWISVATVKKFWHRKSSPVNAPHNLMATRRRMTVWTIANTRKGN